MLKWLHRLIRGLFKPYYPRNIQLEILQHLAEPQYREEGVYGYLLGEHLKVGPSRLYPALEILEENGLIEGIYQPGPEPRRRYYRPTYKGFLYLEEL